MGTIVLDHFYRYHSEILLTESNCNCHSELRSHTSFKETGKFHISRERKQNKTKHDIKELEESDPEWRALRDEADAFSFGMFDAF